MSDPATTLNSEPNEKVQLLPVTTAEGSITADLSPRQSRRRGHSRNATVETSPATEQVVVGVEEEEEEKEGASRPKRARREVDYARVDALSLSGRRKRNRNIPRWYTQSYMMLLALREQPDFCLPRTPLIEAALAMDSKISKERNWPRVFTGKTPKNSASAVLTLNADRYYIPFKPEGSRSTHFRLAYTPGNFDSAYKEYQKWLDKLINHDWLYCFGEPLVVKAPPPLPPPAKVDTSNQSSNDDHDDGDKNNQNNNMVKNDHAAVTSLMTQRLIAGSAASASDETDHQSDEKENKMKTPTVRDPPIRDDTGLSSKQDNQKTHVLETTTTTVTTQLKLPTASTDRPASSASNGEHSDTSPITTTTTTTATAVKEQPIYQLDELDLSNVPKSLDDIVCPDISTIPNAGYGLFATRKLPYNTPLGFYFGVPMTEYEFDSLKEQVGRASEYSIMYRKTVLDATDKDGEPYLLPLPSDPQNDTDNNDNDNGNSNSKGNGDTLPKEQKRKRLCPFHYMNDAKDMNKANVLFVEGVVVNQVIIWTKRDILPGEELLVWYGDDVNRHWSDQRKR